MKLKPCFEIIDLGRGWFKAEIVLGNAIWISKVIINIKTPELVKLSKHPQITIKELCCKQWYASTDKSCRLMETATTWLDWAGEAVRRRSLFLHKVGSSNYFCNNYVYFFAKFKIMSQILNFKKIETLPFNWIWNLKLNFCSKCHKQTHLKSKLQIW